jgi:hypothetical protein
MHSFVGTYIIIVITHTKHNMKIPWMVHHVQIAPLFGVKVPLKLDKNVELIDGSPPWMSILILRWKNQSIKYKYEPHH